MRTVKPPASRPAQDIVDSVKRPNKREASPCQSDDDVVEVEPCQALSLISTKRRAKFPPALPEVKSIFITELKTMIDKIFQSHEEQSNPGGGFAQQDSAKKTLFALAEKFSENLFGKTEAHNQNTAVNSSELEINNGIDKLVLEKLNFKMEQFLTELSPQQKNSFLQCAKELCEFDKAPGNQRLKQAELIKICNPISPELRSVFLICLKKVCEYNNFESPILCGKDIIGENGKNITFFMLMLTMLADNITEAIEDSETFESINQVFTSFLK